MEKQSENQITQPPSMVPLQLLDSVFCVPFPIHTQQAHRAMASWVITSEGVVVVDTGLVGNGDAILRIIRQTTQAPIRYVVYTHGHLDHVGGAPALLGEYPVIIGHENVIPRHERYVSQAPYINLINSIQFHFPPLPPGVCARPVAPTIVYRDRYEFSLGDTRFELVHAMGETDDHTIAHVPDLGLVFAGDLVEASFPNLGNPFKVQRYGKEWYEALEMILAWQPRVVIGGDVILKGEEIQKSLAAHSEVLRYLEETVVAKINEGKNLEQLWEEVQLPAHLAESPYLQQRYSRREFAIYNIWKRYCGYFDFNPAHLLPRPSWEVTAAIREIVADDERVLAKARALAEQGKPHLALQVLDLILANEQDHRAARSLRRDILATLLEQDETVMSQNTWLHYLERDEEFLAKP